MIVTPSPVAEPSLPLRLHPLTYLEDNGEVVVGRADIDSYGLFPPDGAALVRQLAAGTPAGEAARWYAQTYDERVDIDDFLSVLEDLEFIVKAGEAASEPTALRWQRLGRWAFSPAAWVGYIVLIGAAIASMSVHPRLVPRTGELFFTHYLTVLTLVLFLGQFPFLLLHESFHVLAGRRLGLRSTLRLGLRLYYPVFETTMDGLVAVPRRRRYLPMLAGMLADLLVAAALTLIAAATMQPDGSLPAGGRMCLALAFATLLRFSWQFYFYLRTDIYYAAVTALGCVDLQAAARIILRNRFRRLFRRPGASESALHPRDLAVGRWYSWLMAAGYTFSAAMLVLVVVPIAVRTFVLTASPLVHGGRSWYQIADSITFLSLNAVQVLLIAYVIMRSRRRPAT